MEATVKLNIWSFPFRNLINDVAVIIFPTPSCSFLKYFNNTKGKKKTYSCEPLLLVLLSSSGRIRAGVLSGLGGLVDSAAGDVAGGALNDALLPLVGVTVLNGSTVKTSYAEALLGIGAGKPSPAPS